MSLRALIAVGQESDEGGKDRIGDIKGTGDGSGLGFADLKRPDHLGHEDPIAQADAVGREDREERNGKNDPGPMNSGHHGFGGGGVWGFGRFRQRFLFLLFPAVFSSSLPGDRSGVFSRSPVPDFEEQFGSREKRLAHKMPGKPLGREETPGKPAGPRGGRSPFLWRDG